MEIHDGIGMKGVAITGWGRKDWGVRIASQLFFLVETSMINITKNRHGVFTILYL